LNNQQNGNYITPIQELEKVERAELQAEQSLQISESGDSVACQKCGKDVAIPLTAIKAGVYNNRAHNSKIVRLQNQMEEVDRDTLISCNNDECFIIEPFCCAYEEDICPPMKTMASYVSSKR
jgi:hypothetical protein